MTSIFYTKFWSLIKFDVVKVWDSCVVPNYQNHTNVVLLTKIKKPLSPKDFRPIALCNVAF